MKQNSYFFIENFLDSFTFDRKVGGPIYDAGLYDTGLYEKYRKYCIDIELDSIIGQRHFYKVMQDILLGSGEKYDLSSDQIQKDKTYYKIFVAS